jgi:type I restriction enzyme, S subunit
VTAQQMPQYETYKGSGAFWLGDIPESWSCRQLKYVAALSTEKVTPTAPLRYVGMENVRSNDGSYVDTEEQDPEGLSLSFQGGDVLFGKLRPYLAKSWLASFSGVCSSEFLVLKALDVAPRFLNYVTLSREFVSVVDSSTYGAKMPRASWDFIGMLKVPVPERGTSTQIAKFLDYETAKIDALIEKQQQLIALLTEKRQAAVSHAVTKGLNPDAPIRDSEVEWLGEVPAHWQVVPTKRLFSLECHPAPKNNDMELLSIYTHIGVRPRRELEQKGNRASTTDGYWIVKKGDLIVNKLLAWMGAVGYSDYEGVTSPAYDILRRTRPLNPKFYHYLLRLKNTQHELKRWSRGIMDMRLRLYFEELGKIQVPLPPVSEQDEIVAYVEGIEASYDGLAHKAERQIELLQERRAAIISAAVTGKIDVRGWKAPESVAGAEVA